MKEQSTLQELSSKFEIHQNQISQWKKEFLSSASSVFSKSKVAKSNEKDVDDLYKKIGKIQVENDFLREVLGK